MLDVQKEEQFFILPEDTVKLVNYFFVGLLGDAPVSPFPLVLILLEKRHSLAKVFAAFCWTTPQQLSKLCSKTKQNGQSHAAVCIHSKRIMQM